MQIDWITVSAQIVNFLILVWLLKRFLYQPVLRAIDRREQRITERLSKAQQREQQADEKERDYMDKQKELDQQQNAILSQARKDAEQQRKQWLEQTRQEVGETRRQWQQQVEQEKQEFLNNLRRQSAEAVQALARQTLNDLADAGLEQQVIHKFLLRLENLDDESRRQLADSGEPIQVHSALELNDELRNRLNQAIHAQVADKVKVEYRTSPDLLSGIELVSGGRRLGWNMAEYLDELNDRVAAAFTPTDE